MEKLASGILFTIGLIFVGSLIGPVLGALSGLIVGYVFDDTTYYFLDRLDLQIEPWQLGAALGWVSGFLKTSVSTKSS